MTTNLTNLMCIESKRENMLIFNPICPDKVILSSQAPTARPTQAPSNFPASCKASSQYRSRFGCARCVSRCV